MSMILCGGAAMETLRKMAGEGLLADPVAYALGRADCQAALDRASVSTGDIERLYGEVSGAFAKPGLLVPDHARSHRSQRGQTHVWSRPVQAGMLWSTPWPEVYVASPELIVFQVAREHGLLTAALMALELCGNYAKIGDLPERPALTTPRDLRNFFEGLGQGPRSVAMRAAECAAPGSKSPMESRSYLMVAGPRFVGGRHLTKPVMNLDIPIRPDDAIFLGRSHVKGDLTWKDQEVVVEYDSHEHHFGEQEFERTLDRRVVLERLGYRVISFTKDDFRVYHKLRYKIDVLQRLLGIVRRPMSQAMIQRETALFYGLRSISIA